MKTILTPWRHIDKGLDWFYLKPTSNISPELGGVRRILKDAQPYTMIDLHSCLPVNPRKHYLFTSKLKEGLDALLIYSTGNNAENSYFLWHVPDSTLEVVLSRSQSVIEAIKQSIPVYHTRAMQSEFILKFGHITSAVKPAVLRYFYKDLTGDSSSSQTLDQSEIDSRVKQAIEMEDPAIVMDLRQLNTGKISQYDTFWDECSKFLQEEIGTAVDYRRHTDITHVATAISI